MISRLKRGVAWVSAVQSRSILPREWKISQKSVSSDERTTLECLGLASNTRIACVTRVKGNVEVALASEQPQVYHTAIMESFKYDKSSTKCLSLAMGLRVPQPLIMCAAGIRTVRSI